VAIPQSLARKAHQAWVRFES